MAVVGWEGRLVVEGTRAGLADGQVATALVMVATVGWVGVVEEAKAVEQLPVRTRHIGQSAPSRSKASSRRSSAVGATANGVLV